MPSAVLRSACAVTSTHIGVAIGAAQPQQVVGDRAVAREPLDERRRAPADRRSAPASNGRTSSPRRLGGVAEHQFEVGIGREGVACRRPSTRADVDAFVDGFEQPRERLGLGEVTRREILASA